MQTSTILLVCRTTKVIEAVQGSCASIGGLDLEIYPDIDTAVARLELAKVSLLLVHLKAVENKMQVPQLMRAIAATQRSCAAVVLAEAPQEAFESLLEAESSSNGPFPSLTPLYLELPEEIGKLTALVGTLTYRYRADSNAPTTTLGTDVDDQADEDGLSPLMKKQLQRIAKLDTTVLLTGETGSGKTRLAHMIHELSPRSGQPFQVVDCGCLSSALVESELFGHVKGAFTSADRERIGKLAIAENGTLFLDEINCLTTELQSKLLRVVEDRIFTPVGSNREQPLRARLVAASNVPLEGEIALGRFRADLYYRLNVVGFVLPPLRERRTGILPLANRFLNEAAPANRTIAKEFSTAVMLALREYHWPGNVRELRNVVERVVALCEGPVVKLDDLPEPIRRHSGSWLVPSALPHSTRLEPAPVTLSQCEKAAEMQRIQEALEKHNNNRSSAAAELGISRVGLYKKLHKYGLIPTRPFKLPEP